MARLDKFKKLGVEDLEMVSSPGTSHPTQCDAAFGDRLDVPEHAVPIALPAADVKKAEEL